VTAGPGSDYHVIALDSGNIPPAKEIRARFSVQRVDVLIANAGMATSMGPSLATTADELQEHFAVNTTAPLMLFQALWPLMKEAKLPKFIPISSSVGSIAISELPGGAYGPSKAALNWITRRLHVEGEKDGLISVAVHPGWVL
jgi:NAD(P)-dependent dehydrogenase (short-subunit alcohol dehydrogenase family)